MDEDMVNAIPVCIEIFSFYNCSLGILPAIMPKASDESGVLEAEKAGGILKYPVNFANREYAWNGRKPKGAMI